MPKRQRGKRFRLLYYDRLIGRKRVPSFLIAATLLGLWFGVSTQELGWPDQEMANLLLSAGLLTLGFWLFTLLGPILAYAQTHEDHLSLQTPIYRLKIPYRHIRNTRPVKLQRIYPNATLSYGQRNFLRPFLEHTALAIDLQGLPSPSILLRLFFHRFTFSPEATGLVLLVEDWMGFSRQLSNRIDHWRMMHTHHPTHGASDAADILSQSNP
jgi:hypothetical protein